MIHHDAYFELDPKKKTAARASRVVTHLRQSWGPIIDRAEAIDNMKIVLSRYDMVNVKKMFKDPENMGMEFIAISIMEKVRNILIGERVKAGISVNVNAIDPTAETERKIDKKLLQNRKEIEAMISFMQQQIGLPAEYKIEQEEAKGNKKPYRGNIEMFDKLGLNELDGSQINYFFEVWFKLLHEMRAQDVINFFIAANELSDNIDKWVDDILGKKCIAGRSFVNEITGKIEQQYLAPEQIMCIPGERSDGKDATCIGYEINMTVSQIIQNLGNDFDWERDIPFLINAVNFVTHRRITGIWDGQNQVWGNNTSRTTDHCSMGEFMNFKVKCGYIEWKEFDANTYKMGVNFHGNLRSYPKPPDANVKEDGRYSKESWYTEVTYKSYFFSTGSDQQRLFKFGKLYHQTVEGQEDEYSNYSIFFKKEAGPTIAQVAKPYITIAQEAVSKFRWFVRKAKPSGRAYNYESLIKIATKMFAEGQNRAKIAQVIKMFDEGVNELFTIPEIDGQPVGGGVNPNYDLKNGLDPTAKSFLEVVDWTTEKIKSDIGINDIREAYSPKPNDGFKLQQQALEQSRNATNYISEMIDNLLRQFAKQCLLQVQDIVKYKDTLPYNYLKRAIGQMAIDDILELDSIGYHRYGIFVNSFANYLDRQRVLSETNEAWQKGEIGYEVKMLIDGIDNFRKAAYILAFEQQRAKKEKQDEQRMLHQNVLDQQQQQHAFKMEEINTNGQWMVRSRQMESNGFIQAQVLENASKEKIAEGKVTARSEEIDQKANAQTSQKIAEQSLNRQNPAV